MTASDQNPWQFTERGLIIVPGLDYGECERLWQTTCGVHQQSNWSLGDAANYSFDTLGEVAAQIVDGYAPSLVRQAMWVARRIEISRRHAGLSFSAHRAVAKLSPEAQDELLARAETKGWHTIDITEAVKEYDHVRRRNAQTEAEQVVSDSEVTRVTNGAAHPEPPPLPSEPLEDPAEELRSLIDGIRWVAGDLVLGKANLLSVQDLERRALMALGRPAYSCSPLRVDMPAERLIPADWSVRIEGPAPGSEFSTNTRKWSVELRKGNQRAIGAGPSLTCAATEACLAARLSDLEYRHA